LKFFEDDKDLELSSGYAGFISIEFEIRLLFWNSNFLPLVGFTNDLDLSLLNLELRLPENSIALAVFGSYVLDNA